MAARFREIMNLVRIVCEEENLRVTIKCSVDSKKYEIVAGAVIGGAMGAAIFEATRDDFKPLFQVIAEWPDETKRRLANNIENVMRRFDAQDVAAISAPAIRQEIVAAVVDYCQNETRLEFVGR